MPQRRTSEGQDCFRKQTVKSATLVDNSLCTDAPLKSVAILNNFFIQILRIFFYCFVQKHGPCHVFENEEYNTPSTELIHNKQK